MRLSASSVAFPGLDLSELPRAAKTSGVDGIAINVSERSAMRPDTSAALVADFKEHCEAEGLAVSAVYGYAGRRLLLDSVARDEDIDLAKRSIDLAVAVASPVCRMFASTGPGDTQAISRFLDACVPIFEHAQSAGIVLAFPTHHDLAYDAASCKQLVERFGRSRTGIIFTGPNLELDGVAPLEALRAMTGIVEQVELKDWRRHDGHATPAPIGEGEAVVWPIVEALAHSGYAGWITLHHLKQHHPELPDLDSRVSAAVRLIAERARAAAF